MSSRRLIDRQTGLLRHLTSDAFIFGTGRLSSAALDPDLEGLNISRLRLEAEFSYHKRISRIEQTFSRTAMVIGGRFKDFMRGFASACPPRTYERYADAKAFYDYCTEVGCSMRQLRAGRATLRQSRSRWLEPGPCDPRKKYAPRWRHVRSAGSTPGIALIPLWR